VIAALPEGKGISMTLMCQESPTCFDSDVEVCERVRDHREYEFVTYTVSSGCLPCKATRVWQIRRSQRN
jgi:hypothetical protein